MTEHRLRDAAIGALYLVVIVGLIALSIAFFNHSFTSYTTVSLRTDSVGSSLREGSDVKVRGVLVGDVDSITTDGDGAVLHLNLDPGKVKHLPDNVTARLLPKTLFGEKFVALQIPTDPSAQNLRSGDRIGQDRSAQSIELEQLFTDLQRVLVAVRPEMISATLGEVSAALRNRGTDIARTMTIVGGYLDDLAPHVPQITKDLQQLATTAVTYTSAAPDIIDALDSLRTTSATIVSQRDDLRSLLASVTTMSNTVRSFVSGSQDDIIGLSRDSLPSLKIVADYASEFPCLSRALVNYIPVGDKAFGAGTKQPGAHVKLHVVPRVKPYSTADLPTFAATGSAKCPYTPPTALASTAVAGSPDVAGAGVATTNGATADGDIGTVNSPQENQLIAELVAPSAGLRPDQFPDWSSFLLGPALRGTQVSVK